MDSLDKGMVSETSHYLKGLLRFFIIQKISNNLDCKYNSFNYLYSNKKYLIIFKQM